MKRGWGIILKSGDLGITMSFHVGITAVSSLIVHFTSTLLDFFVVAIFTSSQINQDVHWKRL